MRRTSLVILIALICVTAGVNMVYADDYIFDPAMLGKDVNNVDISLFNQDVQLPGVYPVNIFVGGQQVDMQNINFSLQHKKNGKPFLQPCLTVKQLAHYGVKVEQYPGLLADGENIKAAAAGQGRAAQSCVRLAAITDADYDFNFYQQTLILNIPQIALRPRERGIAPEVLWNDGIPAFLLNYRASTYRTENRDNRSQQSQTSNLQLEPRLNLGAWRLKNLSTWKKSDQQSGHWQSIYTYAERGLNSLKSRLTLGDRSTPSDVFDSVPFRGVMLASDENMVPYNQRVFSPVIRGIARTNAHIEVKQNGYVIYTINVSPGPFAITDLPNVSGGDLSVTVMESDGKNQFFTVPYSIPVIALKQGYLKYNLMLGQYRPSSEQHNPSSKVAQLTAMYGLPLNLTVFAGVQATEHFNAASVGVGAMLGDLGAISVDTILSQGQRQYDNKRDGQKWRIRYSKTFYQSGTSIDLSNEQYSSPDYMTLQDVVGSYDPDANEFDFGYGQHYKSKTSLQFNQSLGEWGYINFSGSHNRYWDNTPDSDSFNVGYNTTIGKLNVNLNWSENRYEGRGDRIYSLWLSYPLDGWFGDNTSVSYQYTANGDQQNSQTVSLNGNALNNQLDWSLSQRIQSGNNISSADNMSDLRLNWYGKYGQIGGGYSYSANERQIDANLAGGVIVHPHGLTFSQSLGSTVGLVEAPGADNVSVIGTPGIKTDFRGYTAVSYLPPYQESLVSLDATTLPDNADVTQTDLKVVPTYGAVVPAYFNTHIGARAMIHITQKDGKAVPFGALVSLVDQPDAQTGVAGDEGNTYMSGLPKQGSLKVQWGDNLSRQCQVRYQLPDKINSAGIYNFSGVCQ